MSVRFRCRFCGHPLPSSRDAPLAAIKHAFFDHSPLGKFIKRRYLNTDT